MSEAIGATAKREIEVVVLSDLHLGTGHCQAEALERYLEGIAPRLVVLNGDIIDLREMGPGPWPASHTRVLSRLIGFCQAGTPVHYIVGNHDDALRRIAPVAIGSLQLQEEAVLEVGGEPVWFVHGDRIEHAISVPRIARRLGCWLYHAARHLDRLSRACGWTSLNLVVRLQSSPKIAAHLERFEQSCTRHAAERGIGTIVTGHVHCPRQRTIDVAARQVTYLNSGDWVCSRSALEFTAGQGWRVMRLDATGQPLAVAPSAASHAARPQDDAGVPGMADGAPDPT